MTKQISDVYIVESLLQDAGTVTRPVLWRKLDSKSSAGHSYLTWVSGVQIALDSVESITGSRICLTLSIGDDKVYIHEPESTGLFGRKYSNEDGRRLASALRQLRATVSRQCQQRETRAAENTEAIRERIYSQLLFGGPEAQRHG